MERYLGAKGMERCLGAKGMERCLGAKGIEQGRIQDFKLGGGGALKKIAPSGGGAKIFGVFRVKNYDFTPKNYIFSNCGGRRENFWGISCEKFYAKKSYFFQF